MKKTDSTRTNFNPFGEKDAVYVPDQHNTVVISDSGDKWIKVAISFAVVFVIAVLAGNYFFTSNMRSNALESMKSFNSSAVSVHENFSNQETIRRFKGLSEDQSKEEDIREFAGIVYNLGEQLRENEYVPLTEDMDNDQAADIVLPYYAICDSVSQIDNKLNMANDAVECDEFSDKALTMMSYIKDFNSVKDGISGKLSPNLGGKLPDVTS